VDITNLLLDAAAILLAVVCVFGYTEVFCILFLSNTQEKS
jgi:hypothetical protein